MALQQSQTQTGLHSVVLFDKTEGINDKLDPVRVGSDEAGKVVNAENVVIDLSGGVKRRDGYALLLPGKCHSLFSCGSWGLCVIDGALTVVNEDFSLTAIGAIGNSRLSYVKVFDGLSDVVYFVGRESVGKVVNRVYYDWVTPGYVGISSTEAQVLGYLTSPPTGQLIAVFNGRVYIADGNVVRFSEKYDYARFLTQSIFIFGSDVSMLEDVVDGVFVGTQEEVIFLKGSDAEDFQYLKVYSEGVILGTSVRVSSTAIGIQASGDVVVFSVRGEGICIGTSGGEVLNMTSANVDFPEGGGIGACYVNKDKQYVVSIGE